jgi:hypothetical protein
MALEFLNIHRNETRNVSDLGTALTLILARDWTIKDPEASPFMQGWEIIMNKMPQKGVYPNIVPDYAAFTPDNLEFFWPRLQQQLTLRQLLAAANTAPVAPPIDEPLPLPPVDTSGLWPGASTVPPAPVLPAPLPWVVSAVVPVGPGDPFYLPFAPPDPVAPPPLFPWDLVPAPMMPATKWQVTIDDDGGFTSTRPFPVRVVVEGKGRNVYSEAELSDALANGGTIDQFNTDLFRRPPDPPIGQGPLPIEYAAPAAGFPWWLLLLGAGLAFSKRRGS